ncbi:hydroxymethylglutaryl-CoA lyase [Idiomarina baltica]|jgi:hydroxymethylglutaryl-CoA lyase|uniref:hydroxymethylglutaryl-CoA lyase n=1 Tax=Idiomarina baltica TaxID=190892 RepID=UPI0023551C66|nr:hydroxymethylglutaryl-CoA lyase [Idiomarina baltica]
MFKRSAMPDEVNIVEVGPRDGLQNEVAVPTAAKIELINALSKTGLKYIESASFVSPKWVPQMADSGEIMEQIERHSGITYSALTPNLKGLENALAVNTDEVAVFGAASEQFSQRNINCSIDESLERFRPVISQARQANVRVRGYVSCVLGCPYQGDVPLKDVAHVAQQLIEMGCYEVSLGDTIGVGTPLQAAEMVKAVLEVVPADQLALHFHNTYGQALANILACLELGVNTVDSAVAGLGGCPYAKGASGNVATEDVVYMLNGMGIKTGVELDALVRAGADICQHLEHGPRSQVALAELAKKG